MNWREWIKNTSRCPETQKVIEEQLECIINAYFKNATDYALEKLIITFCEPLGILEKHLTESGSFKMDAMHVPALVNQYVEAEERSKKVMRSEVLRQARHYKCFLAEANAYSSIEAGRC
jgi:hypothetical protein